MREIKFRGFHKPSKTWLTHEESLSIIMLQGRTIAKQADGTDLLERHVIEQFTGLSDKNGVDIYEGDVVKDIHNQTNAIVFNCGSFWFNWLEMPHYLDQVEKGEVIGNIHENPELLT